MPRGVPKSGKRMMKHPRMVGVPKSVVPQIPPAPGPSMPDMGEDESMSSPQPTMRKGGKVHHAHTIHHVKEMKHEHGYAHGSKVKHHKEDGSSHHAADHFKKPKKF